MATLASGPGNSDHSITALLAQLSAGNREVEARLIEQVYGELRRLAANYMRRERGNHTLQPTALVNEAYVRLIQEHQVPWQNRAHFFATAAVLMRRILVNQTFCHVFEDGGFLMPFPSDCLKPPLQMCYHPGDSIPTADVKADKEGVVVMVFVDMNDPKQPGKPVPYLEFLVVTGKHLADEDLVEKAVESLARLFE
jgi:hypothetical protein